MDYRLEDIIDISLLQNLQDKLNKILTFPSAIIDLDGKILSASAWQDICTRFHRKNPQCEKECIKSDKYILGHLNEASPNVSYQCPHGLIDTATPIFIEGKHLGNFFTGQFFLEKPDLDFFKKQAKIYGFNVKEYLRAVKEVPVWTKEKLDQYLAFINGLIEIIAGMGLKNLREIESKKALQEIEERNQAIIQCTSDWIWEIDAYGKYCYCSENVEHILGFTADEIIGKSPLDLMPPVERERVGAIFHNIVETKGAIVDLENWNLHKDGHKVCLLTNGFPIFDETGNIKGYRGADKDITVRRKAEEALQSSKNYLDKIINAVASPIFVKDINHKFILVNDAFCKLLDMQADEFIGLTGYEHFPKEEMEVFIAKDKDVFTSGQENTNEEFLTDVHGKIKTIITKKSLFTDASGNKFLVGIINDITVRKLAEAALIESEDKYRTMIENIGEGIGYMNPEEEFVFANRSAEEIFGVDPGGLPGKNLYQFVSKEQYNLIRNETTQRVQGNRSTYEIDIIQPTGEKRIIIVTAVPQHDKNGVFTGTYGVFRDITERKKAEENQRKANERHRSILQTAMDGFWQTDKKGRFLEVNQAYCAMSGYNMPELLTMYISDLEDFEMADNIEIHLEKIITLGEGRFESRHVRKDGTTFDVEMSVQYNPEEGGKLVAFVKDISERKRSAKALIDSAYQYRLLIESANEGILVAQDKMLKFVNPLFQEITGYTEEELLSRPFKEFIHHDDWELVMNNSRKRMNSETADRRYHFRLLTKDKDIKWIEISGVKIEWHGKPATLNFLTDITERRLSEEALRNERLLLRTVIDNIPDSIYCKDTATRKTLANPSAISNSGAKSESEVIGKTDFDLFPKELAERFFADDQSVLQSGHPLINREEYLFDKNGQKQWQLTTKLPLKNTFGNITGMVGIGRNISDRKQAEEEIISINEELRKINYEKDKFFSIIAHDLRSPFNVLLGFTRMMVEDLPSMRLDEIQKIALTMRNSATNLYRLLENLLDWSTIQQGLIPFNPEIMDLIPLVEESLAIMTEPAGNKGIEISYNIPEGLMVYADINILQAIIRNLLFNALKFTPKEGKISISGKTTKDRSVEIKIKDTGIGMSTKMVENLFRLDVQTNRKGTDGEPSTGLGLLICKEFIDKHGGKIWVESEEGKGSVFSFSLPQQNSPQRV